VQFARFNKTRKPWDSRRTGCHYWVHDCSSCSSKRARQIGEQLFMSHATAKTHVSRLLMKLGARDRTQLVVMAYESGLVEPHAP